LLGGSIQAALDYDNAADTPTDEDVTIDGYHAVNVFAEYSPRRYEALTVRAEISNLFDEDYADRATYGGDYLSIEPLNEPGRSFNLSAVMRF
jgi:hemoglobin/transferrin/lactoferrin receptor protein